MLNNDFLNRTPIAQEIRARIDKWDCIKLKTFCTTKETANRVKRQPEEWEKFFARSSSDRLRTQKVKQQKNK
jgi:hypothetical protein